MKHRDRAPEQDDLLRPRRVDMIDMRHDLVKLARLIDREGCERERAGLFPSASGRLATHPRLVAGLMYLQRTHGLSDEAVVARRVETPYFQHFTGETFAQPATDPPVVAQPLARPHRGGGRRMVDDDRLSRVSVDTTVMEKTIAHPTDARIYEKARPKLVGLAKDLGIDLRQTYARKAPRLAQQNAYVEHCKCRFKNPQKWRSKMPHFLVSVISRMLRSVSPFSVGDRDALGRAVV